MDNVTVHKLLLRIHFRVIISKIMLVPLDSSRRSEAMLRGNTERKTENIYSLAAIVGTILRDNEKKENIYKNMYLYQRDVQLLLTVCGGRALGQMSRFPRGESRTTTCPSYLKIDSS